MRRAILALPTFLHFLQWYVPRELGKLRNLCSEYNLPKCETTSMQPCRLLISFTFARSMWSVLCVSTVAVTVTVWYYEIVLDWFIWYLKNRFCSKTRCDNTSVGMLILQWEVRLFDFCSELLHKTSIVVVAKLKCRSADKSLARPGRKQATATEDFDFHISYL